MKQLKIILALILSININAQQKQTYLEKSKIPLLITGATVTTYAFIKPGTCKNDCKIAITGVILAGLPYIVKLPENIKITKTGIVFKLKYKNIKPKKCKNIN